MLLPDDNNTGVFSVDYSHEASRFSEHLYIYIHFIYSKIWR